MKIRKATSGDIKKLSELAGKNMDYHAKIIRSLKLRTNSEVKENYKKYFLEVLRNVNKRVYVADSEGELIGYIEGVVRRGTKYMRYSKEASIRDFFVDKKYRKEGVGRELTDALIKWFKEKKVERIALSVNSENIPAIKFYEKYGFKEVVKEMSLEIKENLFKDKRR